MSKKTFHTVEELRRMREEESRKQWDSFSVGDDKSYHTIEEIRAAATKQGYYSTPEPETTPRTEQEIAEDSLFKKRISQSFSDIKSVNDYMTGGKYTADDHASVAKTARNNSLYLDEYLKRLTQNGYTPDSSEYQAAKQIKDYYSGVNTQLSEENSVDNMTDEYKKYQAVQRMNLSSDSPSYVETQDEINRLKNIRGGAARRDRDTSVYDKAIDMLKDYSKNFSLDDSTSPKDRQALYEDKKKELATKKEALNHLIPDNVSKEEQLAIGLSKDKERVAASQEIKDLEQELKTYERDYSADFYNKYKSADDFEKLSQKQDIRGSVYKPQDLFDNLSNPFTGYSPEKDEEDKLGAYLQAIENESSWAKDNIPDDLRHSWLPGFYTDEIIKEGDQNYWKLINDDEKAMYYYLYNKEGKDAAYEYLNKLSPVLGRRNIGNMEAEAAGSEGLDLILRNIDTIPAKLGGSFTSVADDAANLVTGKEINPYSSAHELSHFADVTRAATSEKIDTATNGFNINGFSLGDAYQAGMSAADMVAASTLFGGNEAAVGLVMSMDAARSKAQELYEKGATNEQIISESLAAGAFEAIFETVSLDLITDKIIKGMLTKKTAPRFIAAALMSAGVEGSEEVFTDIANYVTDIIIMKEKSERQQLIQNYLDAGYSQSEAEEKANADFVQNLYESFMGGAVAGGIFGGTTYGSSTATAASVNSQERAAVRNTGAAIYDAQNIKSLIDAGKSSSDEAVRKQAEKTEKLYNQSDNKSSRKLNKAAGTLYQQLQERNVSDVTAATDNIRTVVSNAVVTATGSENAVIESAIIKSEITRDTLTEEEQKVLQTAPVQAAIQQLRESGELSKAYDTAEKAYTNLTSTAALTQNQTESNNDIFTTSDDGQTRVKGSDEPLSEINIADISDDGITLTTDNGTQENAENIIWGDEEIPGILYGVQTINKSMSVPVSVAFVNDLIHTYQNEENVTAKNIGGKVVEAFIKGYVGDTVSKVDLPQGMMDVIQKEAVRVRNAIAERNAGAVNVSDKKTASKGKVVFEDKKGHLTARQRLGVEMMTTFAENNDDVTIHFYKSKKSKNGKYIHSEHGTANGFYTRDGDIWIDLNAGDNGEGLILFTASHELVHMMAQYAPEHYEALASFLVENYNKSGKSVHDLVLREMAIHPQLAPEVAREEVIARMCEPFFKDIHLSEKAEQFYKTNPESANAVKRFLEKVVAKIKEWYAKIKPQSPIAREAIDVIKDIERAHDLYIAGVNAAIANHAKAENISDEGGVRNEFRGYTQDAEEGNTSDKKRSEQSRDADYLSAVNRGDMETAQRMVDEAAERAFANSKIRTKDGKLRKVYHGTYSKTFTVFDKKLIGTARGGDVGFFGKGFYFAFSEGEARMYGKNLIDAYLDIKNPFDFQKQLYTYHGERSDLFHGGAAAFIVNFSDSFPELSDDHYVSVAKQESDDIIDLSLKEFADVFKKYYNSVEFNVEKLDSDYGDEWVVTAGKKKVEYTDYKGNKRSFIDYDFQQKFYGEKSAKNRINQVYSYLEKVVYDYIDLPSPRDIIQETDFSNALKKRGYDGVIQSEEGDEIVAFEPEQIKSADPVTYDDAGNVIPLSERFNPEQKDIRYDSRDGDLFSFDDDLSFGEDDDISDVITRNYTTHSEAIGEVLKNTADIDIAPGKVYNIVARTLDGYNIDTDTKKKLATQLHLELENAKNGDPEAIVNRMIDVVRDALNDAKVTDEHTVELYDNLKAAFSGRYYLTDEQIMDLKENGESLKSFKNAMTGKMTIINKDTAKRSISGGVQGASELSLEGMFDLVEMEEIFGITRDQWDTYGYHAPVMLMDAFKTLKDNQLVSLSKMASSDDMDYIAVTMAAQFTGAVVQEKYNSRKNPYVRDLVNKFEARKKDAIKKRNAYYAEKMKEIREQRDKRVAEQLEKAKEARKNATVQRKRAEFKERIRKLHKSLRDMSLNPKANKYIPSELMKQSLDVLGAINLDSGFNGERADRFRAKLSALSKTLLERATQFEDEATYDTTVAAMLDDLNETVGDTPLGLMSLDQLKRVHDTLKAVQTNIRNRVQVIGAEQTQYIGDIAFKMMDEIDDAEVHKILGSSFFTKQLSPERFFNLLCGGAKNNVGKNVVYRMLDDGQLKQIELETRFARMFEDLVNDKQAKTLKQKVDIGLIDAQGNKVMISRGMMLSLYMHLMNEDNLRHVMGGGLTIPLLDAYYKGKGDKAWGSRLTRVKDSTSTARDIAKQIRKLHEQITSDTSQAEKNRIWDEIHDLEALFDEEVERGKKEYINPMRSRIEQQMTDYDREWIKTAQQFFDVESKSELNKTTYQLYGFEKAVVNHYFPIHSDTAFVEQKFESIVKDMSLENMGMMKNRVRSANAIFLEDISDVINRQISNVSQYCGMVIPMANVKRVLNVKTDTVSVMDSLRKYDGKAKSYIDKLLGDLVGANKEEDNAISNIMAKARHGIAGASLTMNFKVAIKQAASFPTAAAELGYTPLVKALVKGGKNNWMLSRADKELIYKYSPLLAYRSMGYSMQELGDLKDSGGLVDKFVNSPKMRWAFGWIQAMDTATVGRLWYASQYYVDKTFPDLAKGSDEYYKQVAQVFNNVIERTQPNYTVMQRPELLRSTNSVVKMFTMFMTQRLQNFNIVYDTAITLNKMKSDLKNQKNGVTLQDVREARTKHARAVSSQMLAAAVLVGMTFLADALMHKMNPWRDEDEELTEESITKRALLYLGDSLVGSIAGGSELYNMMVAAFGDGTWYGLSANGFDSVDDLLTNVTKGIKEKDGKYFAKAVKSLAQISGLPLQNAVNILNAVKLHAEDIQDGKFLSYESGVNRTDKQNLHRSWSAYTLGNASDSAEIMDELKDSKVQEQIAKGKSDADAKKEAYSKLRTTMRTLLREDYLKARDNYYHGDHNDADYQTISDITSFMTKSGLYSKPSVQETLDKWWKDEEAKAKEENKTMSEHLQTGGFDLREFAGDTVSELSGGLFE